MHPLLAAAFEQASTALVLFDRDAHIETANAAARRYLTVESAEPWLRRVVDRVIGSRAEIREVEVVSDDQLIEWTVRPVLDAANHLVGVAAEGREVTEQRRAEHEANLLLRLALAIGHTDSLELAIGAALRTVCEAFGWAMGEAWLPDRENQATRLVRGAVWTPRDTRIEAFAAQGTGFSFAPGEGLPGQAWQRAEPVWERRLSAAQTFTRSPLAAAAGLKAAVAIPVFAGDEVVAVLSFYMSDARTDDSRLARITTAVATQLGPLIVQKRAEETHRIAEAKLGGIVSIALDAIISIDEERRITLFNWGAEQIFGYTADEILGQPLDILLPTAARERHATHIAHFATSAQMARRMGERSPISGLRKSGETFPAEASISRFRAGGRWTFTVTLRDITDRQRTEDGLRRAVAARDEVLAVVSHDLRNPLSAINMCVGALRESPPDAETTHELLGTVRESAALMSRIIQDLLDVASIDAGKLSIERRSQSLAPVLVQAAAMFDAVAAEQKITLEITIGERLPDVAIDADRVLQVLVNLLHNACKFTSAGGFVRLRAEKIESAVQISVADTGVGIPSDDLPRVFDRFWHDRRTSKIRSTGLGLAIARGIVEAHGGHIWVESAPGQGSTFTFTLPA